MNKPSPKQLAFAIIVAVALFATAIVMTIVEQIHNSQKPKFDACKKCGSISRFAF
jgi:hypothetical protein